MMSCYFNSRHFLHLLMYLTCGNGMGMSSQRQMEVIEQPVGVSFSFHLTGAWDWALALVSHLPSQWSIIVNKIKVMKHLIYVKNYYYKTLGIMLWNIMLTRQRYIAFVYAAFVNNGKICYIYLGCICLLM